MNQVTAAPLRVLVVEDEPAHAEAIHRALVEADPTTDVEVVSSLAGYRQATAVREPDVAVIDLVLPDGRALELLHRGKAGQAFPILVMTSHGDEPTAVEAIKTGAADYVVKSPQVFAQMPRTVRRILDEWRLRREREQAQADLRVSEERLRLALDAAELGTWQHDVTSDALSLDARSRAHFGIPTGGSLTLAEVLARVHPEDAGPLQASIAETLDPTTGARLPDFEFRVVHPGGEERWLTMAVRVRFTGEGAERRPILAIGTSRDITRRKTAEEALRRQQQQFKTLVEHSPDVIVRFDSSCRHLYANPATEKEFGLPPNRVRGKSHRELGFSAEQADWSERMIRQVFESGAEVDFELRYPPDTGERTYLSRGVPELGPDGTVESALFIHRNVTDRVRSEERSRLLAELLNICPLAITVHDREGNFLYGNQKCYEIHGYSREEFEALNLHDLDVPESERLIDERMQLLARDGEATFEVAHFHRDGHTIPMRITARFTDWQDSTAVLSVAEDITGQRQMEERLRQAEKMEAIGQLAGGVAHDFNNQLAAILGYAELLECQLSDPEQRRCASNIRTASLRAGELTRQLLAFARKGQHATMPVDMHRIIGETVDMLAHTIDRRISLEQRLDAEAATVIGDPSMLHNALLNLGLNARDAMPDGGVIAFSTRAVAAGDPARVGAPSDGVAIAGNALQVQVADTGCGMSDEVKAHLFEPFFTTKGVGKGTGMGLAAVWGTVAQHGGSIAVESEPGSGTTVTITLPLAAGAAASAVPQSQQETAPGRVLGVLVVDDEQMVRDLMAAVLRSAGHHVITAADGKHGLELYRQHWRELDLVILDMIMPGLNGSDTFRAMRSLNPEARVILATGYSVCGDAESLLALGAVGLLHKPFRKNNLLATVAEIIGR